MNRAVLFAVLLWLTSDAIAETLVQDGLFAGAIHFACALATFETLIRLGRS